MNKGASTGKRVSAKSVTKGKAKKTQNDVNMLIHNLIART